MGLKEWAAKAPVAMYGNMQLRRESVRKLAGLGKWEEHPLTGVTATVEAGTAMRSRLSVTRMVGLGVFALAAPKRSGGEQWLTVEGPEFTWTTKVDRKDIEKAHKFAAAVNNAARRQAAVS